MVGLFQFNNGDKVRALITGFEGIIDGRSDYLHDTSRYFIVPPVDAMGQLQSGNWFLEGDIVLVKARFLKSTSHVKLQLTSTDNK